MNVERDGKNTERKQIEDPFFDVNLKVGSSKKLKGLLVQLEIVGGCLWKVGCVDLNY